MYRRLLFTLCLLGGIACQSGQNFQCTEDTQCTDNSVPGLCEPVGHCSFPDQSCASGRRYGEISPVPFGGECTPAPAEATSTGSQTDATSSAESDGESSSSPSASSSSSTRGGETLTTDVEVGCGNGVLDPGEVCDGDNLGAMPTCGDHMGFPADVLVDCSNCSYRLIPPCAAICGDGTIHGGFEQCEGTDVNGTDCPDLGFLGGFLQCDAATCQFDTAGCAK